MIMHAASQTCDKMALLTHCYQKAAEKFNNASTSLKTVIWATSGGEQGIATRCS